MANPFVPQGTLNRLRGSVVIPNFPALNVTAPFLGKGGIGFNPEGDITPYLPTMTGGVPSPEPYLMATVTINLLKSQGLSASYKAQYESLSLIGDIVVTTDSAVLPQFNLSNCSIMSLGALAFNGDANDFTISLHGIYYVNSSLFGG